jgi:hypothetical protein
MRNNKRLTSITTIIVLAAAVAIGVSYKTQPVDAFNPQPDPPGYGLVGITQGQTIRINVINTTNPPEPDTPPNPARVVITFRDGNGNVFRNADGNPIRRVALLKGGESASLDLNANDFARAFDATGRLQLRPVAQIQRADGVNGAPPDPCIPTVEIFNNANGRTQFVLPSLPPTQRSNTPQ